MGYTAPIECPQCSAIQHIEIKDAVIDEQSGNVTFTYSCGCGFSKTYKNASLDSVASLISNTPESQHIADYLGISRESYESYVWPPDVLATIDQQRRSLPNSETKRLLRLTALQQPKQHDERWWRVYDVAPPVVFCPQSNEYGLVMEDDAVEVVGDIGSVVAALEART